MAMRMRSRYLPLGVFVPHVRSMRSMRLEP
jgi:hypothetical protein